MGPEPRPPGAGTGEAKDQASPSLGASVFRASGLLGAATATPTHPTRLIGIATAIAAVLPATGTGVAIRALGAVVAAASTAIPTATAVVAASTTAGAAVVATTAAAAATGLGLVDPQGATHQLGALQGIDGLGLQLGIDELDKGETTLTAGVPLEREGTIRHLTKRREELDHILLLGAEGKIANKNAH